MNFNHEKPSKKEESIYSPEIEKFLNNAPAEIIELLKDKKYYHVTLKSSIDSILVNGLKKDSELMNQEDIEFFDEMYEKYSERRNDQFLEFHIKGKDDKSDDGKRGIYLSSNPDTKLYQVPERLKFFLANLNFLINSGKLEDTEFDNAKSIFEKYYSRIKDDKVVTLEIQALAPAVLESLLNDPKDWDLTNKETIDDFKFLINQYEPNFQIKGNINPKFIALKEEQEISTETLERGIKDSSFIIF